MILAGLDPGKHGAFAVAEIHPKWHLLEVMKWELDFKNKGEVVRGIVNGIRTPLHGLNIVTETIFASRDAGASSMLTFGMSTGLVEGALYDRGATILAYAPSVWKRHMGLSRDKRQSIALAHAWYPSVKLNQHEAEAILLIVYHAFVIAERMLWPDKRRIIGLLS